MKVSTIFKWLYATIFLVLAVLFYWSQVLQENDFKQTKQEIKEIHLEISALTQKLARDSHTIHPPLSAADAKVHISVQLADKTPNLLEEDPYFTVTLPQMLGNHFKPQGILKKALIGRPDNLHPFNGFKDISEMISLCSGTVATLKTGQYETMAPNFGRKIEIRDVAGNPEAKEYWVYLRDDIYWEPLNALFFSDTFALAPQFLQKQRVTAHDFKFFYDAVMNPYLHEAKAAALRTYYADIEEFRVIDDETFVIKWKLHESFDRNGKSVKREKYTSLSLTGSLQPLARFVYQYFADGQKIIDDDSDPEIYRKNSVWAQNFAQHWGKNVIVSCGPYLFDGMDDEGISFKRNPRYFNPHAALINGIQYRFKESFDAVWQDFKTGKIDLCTLSANQLMELNSFLESREYQFQKNQHQAIKSLDYVDMSYYYIGWNLSKPYFSDVKIRHALTLAIDRKRIIEQNLNLMAIDISGPFFLASSAYDTSITPYPFNPQKARELLKEAGWVDLDGDGIRDKIIDGQRVPFRFKLCYFVKSLSTKVIAEYVATAFRNIGIHCELCGLDIADLSRQFEDKSFDAIFMGWKLGTPPEDPRQLWHSVGSKEKGSSNAIGFENAEIDNLIELLSYEYDKKTRENLYHKFHQIIHHEAPYTFLYTPKVRLLFREYVHNLFIPRDRQDLIPGADVGEPNMQLIWLTK